jgi:hypothetical protein
MLRVRLGVITATAAVLVSCGSPTESFAPMASGDAASARGCAEMLTALKATTDDRFVLDYRSGSGSLEQAMSMDRAKQAAGLAADAEKSASALLSELPAGDLRSSVEKLVQSRKDLQLLLLAVKEDRPGDVRTLAVKVGGARSASAELFRKSCPAQASSLPSLAPLSPMAATPAPTVIAPPPTPARWYPKGYQEWQDGLAFRWVKSKDLKCPAYSGGCWGMYVIARDGCPQNLYVELSVENRAGDVVGFTNDLVGSVEAGRRAKLTFTGRGAFASFSKASCY